MTNEMRKVMIKAMKTMKKICENSDCKDCPFDRYCECEDTWEGITAIPADFKIEED